jgi:hypothetical protein
MKRIATTIAIAAIAIGASATTAAARCDCGPGEGEVAILGSGIAPDSQAQTLVLAAIDDPLAEAKASARRAKAEFGSLDVSIATAVAAGEQHVALVPEVKAAKKAKKANAQKKESRPAIVIFRGP